MRNGAACAVRAPQRHTQPPKMADSISQNGDDTWPLLKDLSGAQERDVIWKVGTKVAEGLWDLHSEAHWTPNVNLPTGKDDGPTAFAWGKNILEDGHGHE